MSCDQKEKQWFLALVSFLKLNLVLEVSLLIEFSFVCTTQDDTCIFSRELLADSPFIYQFHILKKKNSIYLNFIFRDAYHSKNRTSRTDGSFS